VELASGRPTGGDPNFDIPNGRAIISYGRLVERPVEIVPARLPLNALPLTGIATRLFYDAKLTGLDRKELKRKRCLPLLAATTKTSK
jgi:hypothetical protein